MPTNQIELYFPVLVHPNTEDAYTDHSAFAMWLGKPQPLRLDILRRSATG